MARQSFLRRMLQLRLLTLLLMLTAGCLVMAAYRAYIEPFAKQTESAKKIRELGGSLRFETPSPEWLKSLIGHERYRNIVTVDLEHCKVMDEKLAVLRDTPYVRKLYLAGNPISDEALKHVATLKHLERLSLWHTKITDEGLARLVRLHKMQALDIHRTAISDDGLWEIAALPELRELKLGSVITPMGLVHVGKLKNLRKLDLSQTRITVRGLPQLGRSSVREIIMRLSSIRGSDLKYLRNLRKLNVLPARVFPCNEKDLFHLAELHHLKSVDVGSNLGNDALTFLAQLPSLEQLQLAGQITPDGLSCLQNTSLKRVVIRTSCVTPANAEQLLEYAGKPNLNLGTPWPLSNAALDQLAASRGRLTFFSSMTPFMNAPEFIYPSDVFNVNQEPFKTVQLYDSWSTIRDWSPLLHYPDLAHLTLRIADGVPWPIEVLEKLPKLKSLDIGSSQIKIDEATRIWKNRKIVIGAVHGRSDMRLPFDRFADRHFILQPDNILFAQTGLKEDELGTLVMASRQYHVAASGISSALAGERPSVGLNKGDTTWDLSTLSESHHVHSLHVRLCNFSREQWQQIWRMPSLSSLEVSHSAFVEQRFRGIESLKQLKQLRIYNSRLSDKEAAAFGRLRNLEELTMNDPAINGDCFRNFDGLVHLRSLRLPVTRVTVEKIAHLQSLPQLEFLDLSHAPVANEVIDVLMAFPRLRWCDLDKTYVTDEARERLERFLDSRK